MKDEERVRVRKCNEHQSKEWSKHTINEEPCRCIDVV